MSRQTCVRAALPIRLLFVLVLSVFATSAFATIFVVPDDAELVAKSDAIVVGIITTANAVELDDKSVETEYEIVLQRVFKGSMEANKKIRFRSPGGTTGRFTTAVDGAAHFAPGDKVLLFLTPWHGGWTPTDLTLGKFRFDATSKGYDVLVRDAEDIVGWDRDGKVHQENVRLEQEFLRFIEETVANPNPNPKVKAEKADYEVPASEVMDLPTAEEKQRMRTVVDTASFPATTYASSLYACDGTRYPGRWSTTTMNAGVQFRKNSAQNATGAGDGGVSIITNALASWTNDCQSAVNITLGATTTSVINPNDGINTILFNDPNGNIPGVWEGSGTIAITFSSANTTEMFGGAEFAVLSDSDIVFQNGYASTEATMNVAMTHEVGHAIGLRHADKHYLQSCTFPGCVATCTEPACDPGVQECAATAVMTAVANSGLGFTLQTWDSNAVNALYPATCVAVTPPTSVLAQANTSTQVQVTWTNSGTATSYNVYRSTNNLTFTKISTDGAVTTTPYNDNTAAANTGYIYKVRGVASGVESSDSNKDFAVTTIFTDSTITAASTKVKAVHFTELTTAANALRAVAALGTISFTQSTPATNGLIRRTHVIELRSGIDAARTTLGFTAGTYSTDPTITTGTTTIKKAHVDQLRAALR